LVCRLGRRNQTQSASNSCHDYLKHPSLPLGAARDVVGIGRGAISGNMKVSFQAARSIG
jgi:hypothetical protein